MSLPNSVFDAALAKIATGTRVSICSANPANFAGIAAVSLGNVAVTAGSGNGDWIIADGNTSGRKLTLTAQSIGNPTSNGTVTYLAVDNGSELLATNPITSQAVTTAQTWDLPEIVINEIADPSYA